MIDLHCHILPDIDDGPETMTDSIELAGSLFRKGYRKIAATPHMVPGTSWMPSVPKIHKKVAELNQAMRDLKFDITIVSGMEIAMDPLIPDLLDQGKVLPLAETSCLLIEPPFQRLPPGWEKVVFDLLAKGYAVLLAHPERCEQFAANPAGLEKAIASGVYLQVNWGSFLGVYGKRAARTAKYLARRGWIHCLATDSHHLNGPIPGGLLKAMPMVTEMIGQKNVRLLTRDNPSRLLEGEPLSTFQVSTVVHGKKKPWWRFWDRTNP